jgi:hypothetical protein
VNQKVRPRLDRHRRKLPSRRLRQVIAQPVALERDRLVMRIVELDPIPVIPGNRHVRRVVVRHHLVDHRSRADRRKRRRKHPHITLLRPHQRQRHPIDPFRDSLDERAVHRAPVGRRHEPLHSLNLEVSGRPDHRLELERQLPVLHPHRLGIEHDLGLCPQSNRHPRQQPNRRQHPGSPTHHPAYMRRRHDVPPTLRPTGSTHECGLGSSQFPDGDGCPHPAWIMNRRVGGTQPTERSCARPSVPCPPSGPRFGFCYAGGVAAVSPGSAEERGPPGVPIRLVRTPPLASGNWELGTGNLPLPQSSNAARIAAKKSSPPLESTASPVPPSAEL